MRFHKLHLHFFAFFDHVYVHSLHFYCIGEGILEVKTDCSAKDLMFFASFAFCVITLEPIMIQTISAPQNDRLNFSFVKDIRVVVEKMTKNCRKMIEKTAESLLCPLHSIQFSPLCSIPSSMFYCSKSQHFLIAFPPLKANVLCESSLRRY